MKAIRVHAYGGPEVMRYEDIPQPVAKEGEAVVKIEAVGVNFIDVYFRTGGYKAEVPFTPGQEASGTVASVGPGVKDMKVGDQVAYTGVQGSYAEFAAVPAQRLVMLPSGFSARTVSFRRAALSHG